MVAAALLLLLLLEIAALRDDVGDVNNVTNGLKNSYFPKNVLSTGEWVAYFGIGNKLLQCRLLKFV